MIKQISKSALSIFLCIFIALSFCSCEAVNDAIDKITSTLAPRGIIEDISLGYTEIDSTPFSYSPHYTPYISRDSYNCLRYDNMRKLYDLLLESVYFVYPEKNSTGEYKTRQVLLDESLLSEADIRLTVKALTDDNPQIFWLTSTFGYLVNSDSNYTAVQLYSHYSPDTLAQYVSELKTAVNSFYATLSTGMTEYQLELAVHDMILDVCDYDEEITDETTDIPYDKLNDFSPYGVLVNNIAVCEGYARTFQLLVSGVGIHCINITGKSEGELHMWNAVELDGDWYYVDPTWDDNGEQGFEYDYFNISEEQLCIDHEFCELYDNLTDDEICGTKTKTIPNANFFIPDCDSVAFNYYVRNCAHLKSYDSDSVVKSLTTSATKKEQYFSFYIDPDKLSFDYAVDQLFYSYPQYFFDYVDIANSSLPDFSIDKSNLSLYEKKHLNTVLVVLEYI